MPRYIRQSGITILGFNVWRFGIFLHQYDSRPMRAIGKFLCSFLLFFGFTNPLLNTIKCIVLLFRLPSRFTFFGNASLLFFLVVPSQPVHGVCDIKIIQGVVRFSIMEKKITIEIQVVKKKSIPPLLPKVFFNELRH